MGDGASTVVMQDPQGSIVTILRPWSGFEATYQGVDLEIEVPFVGPNELNQYIEFDNNSGKRPNLSLASARYVSVPRGSNITIWFPRVGIFVDTDPNPTWVETAYKYTFHWRLRTLGDYRFDGRPWSIPGLLPVGPVGADVDSTVLQTFIPSARGKSVVPFLDGADITPLSSTNALLRLSNGVYRLSEAITDPYQIYGDTFFEPYTTKALGDELLITATRVSAASGAEGGATDGTWDFQQADQPFSVWFGNEANIDPAPPVASLVTVPFGGILLFTENQ
jgi:hypothetical protein